MNPSKGDGDGRCSSNRNRLPRASHTRRRQIDHDSRKDPCPARNRNPSKSRITSPRLVGLGWLGAGALPPSGQLLFRTNERTKRTNQRKSAAFPSRPVPSRRHPSNARQKAVPTVACPSAVHREKDGARGGKPPPPPPPKKKLTTAKMDGRQISPCFIRCPGLSVCPACPSIHPLVAALLASCPLTVAKRER